MWFLISLPVPGSQKAFPAHPCDGQPQKFFFIFSTLTPQKGRSFRSGCFFSKNAFMACFFCLYRHTTSPPCQKCCTYSIFGRPLQIIQTRNFSHARLLCAKCCMCSNFRNTRRRTSTGWYYLITTSRKILSTSHQIYVESLWYLTLVACSGNCLSNQWTRVQYIYITPAEESVVIHEYPLIIKRKVLIVKVAAFW